jgi:cytidylate kinase
LIGSFEKRVTHFQENFRVREDQARDYVAKEEKRRTEYIRKYFSKDVSDPLLYNVVINTDDLPLPSIVAMIGDLVLGKNVDSLKGEMLYYNLVNDV